MYNTKEAVFYLLEQLPSEDDGSIDLESSDDDELDPDFVPNHYDFVEENPTLSPPLPISVQNTDTSDDNAKGLSDDVDSTDVSVALPELLTTAYDWKNVKIDYEVSQFLFHEGPVEEHYIDCNSPCDFSLKFFDEKIRENFVFQTNLYIQQKQKGKSVLPVKERVLYGFIGINLFMGYHKLLSWLDYRKCDPDLSVPFVSSVNLDYVLVRFCRICM